jgi:histidinol-phosphate aminotransferase
VKDLEFQEKSVAHNAAWLPWLQDEFKKLGLEPYPSVTNFFITRFPTEAGKTAGEAREYLAKRGIMVRSMSDYGEHAFIRVSIGQEDENRALIQGLTDFFNGVPA